MIDVLINLTVVITSQCIRISNHHVVHLKHIQFLFANYTLVKLGVGGSLTVKGEGTAQLHDHKGTHICLASTLHHIPVGFGL